MLYPLFELIREEPFTIEVKFDEMLNGKEDKHVIDQQLNRFTFIYMFLRGNDQATHDPAHNKPLPWTEKFARMHLEMIDKYGQEIRIGVLIVTRLSQPGTDFEMKFLGCTAPGGNIKTNCEIIEATSETSQLCSRCYMIFSDPRNAHALLANPENPREIDHHSPRELRSCSILGCSLCSEVISACQLSDFDDPEWVDEASSLSISDIAVANIYNSGIILSVARGKFRLHHFASSENISSTVVSYRPDNTTDTNERATKKIQEEFQRCFKEHSSCPGKNLKTMPLRVLDIKEMRLQETSQLEQLAPYAALSYCWGRNQTFVTTKDNLRKMSTIISLEDLPRTLQDAVKVATQLSIRYLWIDALCIVQNDDIEKAVQLGAMSSVYKNALVVIVASSAKAVDEGFLKTREPPKAVSLPIFIDSNSTGQLLLAEREPALLYDFEPITKRGWTFQEMCLAPRALLYTEKALLWQCSTVSDPRPLEICTVGPESNLDYPMMHNLPTSDAELLYNWDLVVVGYTQRLLSYEEDRLPALAGVASEMKLKLKTDYLAGMWRTQLESQLCWRRDSGTLQELSQKRNNGPSWSWASVTGPVTDAVLWAPSKTARGVKVISCDVDLCHSEAPFGQVASGRLVVDAFLVPAKNAPQSWFEDTTMDYDGNALEEVEKDELYCMLVGCTQDNSCDKNPPEECQWRGLLLRCLDDQTFQRVGIFMQRCLDDEDDDLPDVDVTLEDMYERTPQAKFPRKALGRELLSCDKEFSSENYYKSRSCLLKCLVCSHK